MPFRAHKGYYGVDRVQEHSREEVIRDIRPVSSRFFGALLGQGGYAAAFCAALGLMAFEPATAFPVLPLLALLCLCRRVAVSRDILPMRVPQSWKGKDYGDMTPQGSFRRARGMFYIGNDLEANRELWISRDDILTHMLILGTTGSGKTETLVSLAFNYLAVGGGLLYVDPKAAPKLAVQLYTMCRIMGRDDDFLLLSYMVSRAGGPSGKSGLTRTPQHESNTQNPFAVGGANQLTQLLFSLMPGDDDSSGNAIFSSNACSCSWKCATAERFPCPSTSSADISWIRKPSRSSPYGRISRKRPCSPCRPAWRQSAGTKTCPLTDSRGPSAISTATPEPTLAVPCPSS